MDIHELGQVTAEDLAKAHAADLKTQEQYGVEYLKYWFNESCGKAFCLVHAPSREAADKVHREAHGLVAEKLIEVQPEIAEGFLGGIEVNPWEPFSCRVANRMSEIPASGPFYSRTLWAPPF